MLLYITGAPFRKNYFHGVQLKVGGISSERSHEEKLLCWKWNFKPDTNSQMEARRNDADVQHRFYDSFKSHAAKILKLQCPLFPAGGWMEEGEEIREKSQFMTPHGMRVKENRMKRLEGQRNGK